MRFKSKPEAIGHYVCRQDHQSMGREELDARGNPREFFFFLSLDLLMKVVRSSVSSFMIIIVVISEQP